MPLNDFFELIDKREYTPYVYIVRLEYKYVYEDKLIRSNEILQFDPGYIGVSANLKYPWYHDCWLWYCDWYMCVDPESVRVIDFVAIDDVKVENKGEWIDWKGRNGRYNGIPICSNCNTGFPIFAKDYNFCPNCGADMRGE